MKYGVAFSASSCAKLSGEVEFKSTSTSKATNIIYELLEIYIYFLSLIGCFIIGPLELLYMYSSINPIPLGKLCRDPSVRREPVGDAWYRPSTLRLQHYLS
jgi:hypothetical protein